MVRLVLAYGHREDGSYLEGKVRETASASILAIVQQFEELPAMIKRHRAEGVLLDISADPDRLLPLVQRLMEEAPATPILLACDKSKCNPELLLAAMRLKVQEFLPIPFGDDLKAAIQRLRERSAANRPQSGSDRGRLACVISSKGGSGSTLIATNLAVSLVRQSQQSTLLADLNLQLGDVSLFLNLKPQLTITDLIQNIERLDGVLLQEMLTKHASGVQVLAAPKRLEESGLLTREHLQRINPLLKSSFDWTVIDLPVAFDDPVLGTLPYADDILLVTLLNIPSLRNTKRYLEIFERLGCPSEKVKLVVNRYYRKAEGDLSLKEAEEALGHPVFFSIPNDYLAAISSINQGVPLGDLVPKTPIVQAFDELARLLCGAGARQAAAQPSIQEEKSKTGLFGRFFKTVGEVH